MYVTLNRATDYSTVFLRIALGISFLSAVADRFGLWGAYGQPNVAWVEITQQQPIRFMQFANDYSQGFKAM